jgi:hypothetical protein
MLNKLNTIRREEIEIENYREIFDAESHHVHVIYLDSSHRFRWKENLEVNNFTSICYGL